ncbi:MAG: serine hydrolase [Candidatus Shapirobacteria bacterium]
MKSLLLLFLGLFSIGGQKNWVGFIPQQEAVLQKKFNDNLTARSWMVLDLQSGQVLTAKDPNIAFAPASLTKIATALVALDYYDLDKVLEVKERYWVGRHMGLLRGERIKVIDLLFGLLVHSANDAAYNLASNYSGGVSAFVEKMNLWVKEKGLERTHFANFDGEEDENHYSTAADLAKLARIFLQNPLLAQIVDLEEKVVSDISGSHRHYLQTTNELLGQSGEIRGLKTGWTEQAGECFVGLFEIEESGQAHPVLTVVLGSNDRFGETLTLLNWAKESISWKDHSATHSLEIAGTKAVKL